MGIALYLEQLSEDIRLACQNALGNRQESAPDNDRNEMAETFFEHINDVEEYLHGQQIPLSEILGVATLQLPPPEKLTEAQRRDLYIELELLLKAFNFYPDFPHTLPEHFRYKILRTHWDEEHIYMRKGQSHLEFCEYDPSRCPFPIKYCDCRNL